MINTLVVRLRRHPWPVLGLIVLLLIVFAVSNRFILDDAFISFRYAQNLVSGSGLTWNAGERVEGYTSFLWTMIISVAFLLNIDPVSFTLILGLILFAFTLILTYNLSLLVFHSNKHSLLTVTFLGTNYTFSAYATSGLETQLQACILVLSAYLVFRVVQKNISSPLSLAVLSLLFAVSLLTRLDSSIFLLVFFPLLLFCLFRNSVSLRKSLSMMQWLFFPAIVIVGGWFMWKLGYYGDILPNTYYAKAASAITTPKRGLVYCYEFLLSYWLIPFPFLALVGLKKIFAKENYLIGAIATLILLWCLYIIRVGGDFMEFRFFVPVLPFLFMFITWIVFELVQQREIRIPLIAIVLIGSLHHTFTFGGVRGIESINELQGWIRNPDQDWDQVGRVFGKLFHDESAIVRIATTAAGAIPFYSHLATVDMHGLNDQWIAKDGKIRGTRPGHQRLATFDYLLAREVNLVIGHPRVEKIHTIHKTAYSVTDLEWFGVEDIEAGKVPPNSKVLELPLNEDFKITVLYLVQNSYVDQVIEKQKLRTYVIIKS